MRKTKSPPQNSRGRLHEVASMAADEESEVDSLGRLHRVAPMAAHEENEVTPSEFFRYPPRSGSIAAEPDNEVNPPNKQIMENPMSDDNGNDSKTLDGSDGSTLQIDQGDRLTDDSPLLIRKITTDVPDAEKVTMETLKKLNTLTPEQLSNLDIPTPQEQHSAGVRGDWKDNLAGNSQDEIAVSRMSDELATLQAEEAKYIANGSTVPLTLQNALIAKTNSLNYQLQAMRNAAVDPATEEFDSDRELMLSSYRTDMSVAVNRMMKDERVDKPTAMTLVQQKIDTFGAASELPQYARIKARMSLKYPGVF